MNFIRQLFGKAATQAPHTTALPDEQGSLSASSEAIVQPTTPLNMENVSDKPTNDTKAPPARSVLAADGATRPLPVEILVEAQNGHIEFGQSTDKGMIRSNNQDAVLSFMLTNQSVDEQPDFGLFIVADGMGGHHDGERASAITIRSVMTQIMNSVCLPMFDGENDADRPTIVEALVTATQNANSAVMKEVTDGGTTLTAAAVVGNLAYVIHVGDSRAYLIAQDEIEQLTRDHSLVQRLIELNQLTPEEAKDHPQVNVLYRALGQSENLEVERLVRPLPASSQLLLCSDGLWGLVKDEDMLQIIQEANTPQEACDKLVAQANMNGGRDNITAVLLKMPSS